MHSTVHIVARLVQRKVTPYATHGSQKRARDVWPDSMTALRPAERPDEVHAPCLQAELRNLSTTEEARASSIEQALASSICVIPS